MYVHDVHSWIDLAFSLSALGLARLIRIGARRLEHSLDRKEAEREEFERLRIRQAAKLAVEEYERDMERKRLAENSIHPEHGHFQDSG